VHLDKTLEHFERFGFDAENVSFIPYSSRRSWIEKYPLAFPHVHCSDNGDVMGFPFWSGDSSSSHGHVAGRMTAIAAASLSNTNTAAAMTANATPTTPNNSRGRKKKKIIPTAHLPNEEREELHIEMYKYFQWLRTSLATAVAAGEPPQQQQQASVVSTASSDKKKRRSVSSAAGVNLSALQNLMEGMESTFKVVRNAQPAIAAASATAVASTLPFLEEVLGEPLGKLVDVVRKDPEAKSARTKRSRGLAFEDMYERLLQFNQEHGHVNVAQKYSQDGQLGSWVANIRSKRKQMAKKGEEFELDVPLEDVGDNDDGGEDDDDAAIFGIDGGGEGGEGGGGESGKKRKRVGGRQRLTRDRIVSRIIMTKRSCLQCCCNTFTTLHLIYTLALLVLSSQHKLDTIGFQWVVANPNTKSWDERFEDLKEYQQMHGTTRVPRSSGTLGEWVHMQRRLYNKKDPNFLARRAPLLEDIGFEWHPRKHALVSWDDNFNRLMEFGRINRHYNVQSPFPEGYLGDHEGEQDAELVEAQRFHKWVRRIHAEYRAYASGKMSRMLNDARVMQLREIGFQFSM